MKHFFPDILKINTISERRIDFRNSLFNLSKTVIEKDNFHFLTRIYKAAKLPEIKSKILKLLYDLDFPELKEFFYEAYKRERDLNMKIYALRGLSNFITEPEIAKLLQKFNQTLEKRQKTTPYNYIEYELLRGKNALPYLIKKYNYPCFKETLEQVNKQYNIMPEAFKGHFTADESGEIISLRRPGEVKRIMNNFWEEERKKYL